MSSAPIVPSGTQQCVTASDLVRHFGLWQERAAQAPVFVLHRGRPRFALTAIGAFDRDVAPRAADLPNDAAVAALLDASDDIAVIVDKAGVIVCASRIARARFGEDVRAGLRVAAVPGAEFLADAITRVAESGISEDVEVVPARYPTRRMSCAVTPFPGGCLIRSHDLTAEDHLRTARARGVAALTAAAAVDIVTARIGPRGYLIEPSLALSQITGIPRESLNGVRLVSLIDVVDRVKVGDAIETVFSSGRSARVDVGMLVRGAVPLKVAIGMSAAHFGTRVDEVVLVLATHVANTNAP